MLEHVATNAISAREKVLASALKLFTEKGYFSTSMRDITRESAISTGSIYHHFKDKEGVADALYQHLIERMRSEFQLIIDANRTAHDRCYAVVRLLFDIAENKPHTMTYMLYTKHREFLHQELPLCSSEPFKMMRAMVEYGMQSNEIEKRDVMVASTCLFGGPIRMITSYLDGLLDKPLSHYLDDTWTCSWKAVANSSLNVSLHE